MRLWRQCRLDSGIKSAVAQPDYPSDYRYPALALLLCLQARSLLELRIRAVRVVDELLVQCQRLRVHEALAAAIALHRSVQLKANVLDGSITAHREWGDFRHGNDLL